MESGENKKMTLEEAERFYKNGNCNTFHMYREYTSLYHEFMQLKISEELLMQWKQETIEKLFAELWKNTGNNKVAFKIMDLFELIESEKNNIENNVMTLFKEIRKAISLDYLQRIIIIEQFAGTDTYQTMGFCYFICKNTNFADEMNEIVKNLMDFHCNGDEELEERLERAKKRYEYAFDKFSKQRLKKNTKRSRKKDV